MVAGALDLFLFPYSATNQGLETLESGIGNSKFALEEVDPGRVRGEELGFGGKEGAWWDREWGTVGALI